MLHLYRRMYLSVDYAFCDWSRYRLDLEDKMAAEKSAFKEAADSISTANLYPEKESCMRGVFMVARTHGALVCYAVNVRVVSLNDVVSEGRRQIWPLTV